MHTYITKSNWYHQRNVPLELLMEKKRNSFFFPELFIRFDFRVWFQKFSFLTLSRYYFHFSQINSYKNKMATQGTPKNFLAHNKNYVINTLRIHRYKIYSPFQKKISSSKKKKKLEITRQFQNFRNLVNTRFSRTIKILRNKIRNVLSSHLCTSMYVHLLKEGMY